MPPDREPLIHCPDCGAELSSDPAAGGLCPSCLLRLAREGSEAGERLDELETLEKPSPEGAPSLSSASAPTPSLVSPGGGEEGLRLSPGQVLNERYWIQRLLGRGGMGEVWHALDLKLRVDVALKSLRSERLESEEGRELLRQEVRTAREVVSPNVCRVFDLVEVEEQELLSMEHIDGQTLISLLKERGPLPVPEAGEIASQFLVGLEAVHEAGLVHRDFKPENVMITRSGRVVVMDFGIALKTQDADGRVAGTPAYMAPEQRRGETLDARTDVYAAGVTLAEMVSGEGIQERTSRESLWEGIHADPPRVPEGPWARVIRKAVSPDPGDRYATARDLIRALEVITLRVEGAEETHPYPGLASFTEAESRHFFGREAEVEEMLRKLRRAPLLGVIGPSGAGKSSFLRAGVIPALPEGWGSVYCQPGKAPFASLAQALVARRPDEAEALGTVAAFEDLDAAVSAAKRWREGHEEAVVLVDQFEELFTLNPPETQARFAELVGRLASEADVRVLLSMRDDFLLECSAHGSLAPVFSELTPLRAPTGASLHRALVQPALSLGYRFEDEALVREMLEEVSRERGALPLLAFAAAGLWERRDREEGVLTREAYASIGGVAGALAQHAEETLKTIGQDREPVVRELFRNLVTAQGTRAVRDREELLSVFEDREAAGEVLRELVSARLLTSFETTEPAKEDQPEREVHRIEVIHESLLRAWPRLVRWQTQDADGAQLRDELRLAAQVWQDRGRPEDLLWSGTAYRDFAVWRERYPGGLTATEEAFATAATRHAQRQRRRRRTAGAVLITALAAVAIGTSVLWQRSEDARRRAEAETRRAEASKLLALAQLEIETYPTGALAYATKSLELADTLEARLFALRALQRGPIASLAKGVEGDGLDLFLPAFSPSGEWLALGGFRKAQVWHRDSGERVVVGDYPGHGGWVLVRFGPDGRTLLTNQVGHVRAWTVPEGRNQWSAQLDEGPSSLYPRGEIFFTATTVGDEEVVRRWTFQGESHLLGHTDAFQVGSIDPAGARLAYALGPRVYLRSLDTWSAGPRLLGTHSVDVRSLAFHPGGDRLAVGDVSGKVRVWGVDGRARGPERSVPAREYRSLRWDPTGRWLGAFGQAAGKAKAWLWDTYGPPDVAPFLLERPDNPWLMGWAFDPSGRWLLTAHATEVAFWPLGERHPRVLLGHEAPVYGLAFTLDGESLVSGSSDGVIRVWPLSAYGGRQGRVLARLTSLQDLALDPQSRFVAAWGRGGVQLIPLAGGPTRELPAASGKYGAAGLASFAFSADGDRLAAAPWMGRRHEKLIHVWDLETGAAQVLGPVPGAGEGREGGVHGLRFLGRERVLAGNQATGLQLFDLADGSVQILGREPMGLAGVSPRQDLAIGLQRLGGGSHQAERYSLVRFDLGEQESVTLASHGDNLTDVIALDPSGNLVASGKVDGTVRVGPVTGEEPHHFSGHEGIVGGLAFSPDGKWLASGGWDGTIRLWPVPDASEPPFHTLPYEEILETLRAQTNLRAVPDAASPTGYRLEPGPFPGWAEVPEW